MNMDKTTYFVFCGIVVCMGCVLFTTNATFTVNKRPYTKDGKCLVDVRVGGNGVEYTATEACEAADKMQLRYTAGGLLLGDCRSNALCLYTDTPGELVVIRGRECYNVTNVTRTTEGEGKGKGNDQGKGEGKGEGKVEGNDRGKGEGKGEGNDQGKVEGKGEGKGEGNDQGKGEGKGEGKVEGNDQGKGEGKGEGKVEGNDQGKGEGKGEGKVEGNDQGKGEGKGEGKVEGHDQDKGDGKGDGKVDDQGKGDGHGNGKGEGKSEDKVEGKVESNVEGEKEHRAAKMLASECSVAKQKVKEVWKRSIHIGVMEKNIAGVNLVRRRYIQHGMCVQELHLKGNGSDTSLAMSCEQAEGLEVLHTPQGVVVGDYRKDEVCVIVGEAVGLVVIQGDVCSREFSSGGIVAGQSVTKEQCDDAKKTIETLWENNRKDFNISRRIKYTKKNRCVEEFTFFGKGVDASIKVRCEVGQKLDILKLDEVFIIGDYRESPICVFQNGPTSLVAIKEEDGYKVCREDVFEEQVTRRTLLPFDCASAKQFVKDQWDGATGKEDQAAAEQTK